MENNRQYSDSKNPAVSIIMPVYNTPEEYLRPAIDSIRNQTWTDWELICADDGSDEETAAVLREYEAEDSRIRRIETHHVGAGFARNAGLAQACGTAVIFLDSDDLFQPELLEQSYQNLIASSADILLFPYQNLEEYQLDPHCAKYGVYPAASMPAVFETKEYLESLFSFTNAAVWNKMIRRDFLLKTGLLFTNLVVTQDCLFIYTLLYLTRRIAYLTDPFLLYRCKNSGSLMHTCPHIPEEVCQAFLQIKQNLEQQKFWPRIQSSFLLRYMEDVRVHFQLLPEEGQRQFKERLKTVYFPALGIDASRGSCLTRGNRAFYRFIIDQKPWFGKRWGFSNKREIYFFKIKIFQYTRKKR